MDNHPLAPKNLHDMFTLSGWQEFVNRQDAAGDVHWFRRRGLVAWYSQDEGCWGVDRGDKHVIGGLLGDGSLERSGFVARPKAPRG